jgi:serine protease
MNPLLKRAVVTTAALACVVQIVPSAFAGPARKPVDPLRSAQWGLAAINAPQAWAKSTGRGVIVAVIDTGIDLTHPDLRHKLVRGANFVTPGTAPQDDNGHGSHVAGIIAASTNNGIGIAGIAPDARLMPVKVLDKDASGDAATIAKGIRYAADHGARVLNLSLTEDVALGQLATGTGQNSVVASAIEHAWRKGAVVIFAAGNQTAPLCSPPGDHVHAICVGAVDRNARRTWFSQGDGTMRYAFLCAPGGSGLSTDPVGVGSVDNDGENILSTVGQGTEHDSRHTGYVSMAGTSMAAPMVSGVAALLVARGLKSAQVVQRLLNRAVDVGAPGRDPVYGYGLLDAVRALR